MKYLLMNNDELYTVKEGEISEVEYESINADLFNEYGIDSVPETELILSLDNPVIICYNETDFEASAVISAVPPLPQILTSNWVPFDESIVGIRNITLTGSDNIRCRFMFDENEEGEGQWVTWNPTTSTWDVSDDAWNTKGEVEAATDYPEGMTGFKVQFQFLGLDDYITEMKVYYINIK